MAAFPSFQVTFNISADHSNAADAAALVDSLRQMEQVVVPYASNAPAATEGVHPAITIAFLLKIDHSNGSSGSDATAISADSRSQLVADLGQFVAPPGTITVTQV